MATLRPGIGMKRALLKCVENLEQVWDLYAEALIAPTPAAAQSLSVRAQKAMDTAADPIVDARRLQDVTAALDQQVKPIPERIFEALDMLFPQATFRELLASGSEIAGRALGLRVGNNSGLSYLLLEPIAETSLDPLRFKEKLREASLGSFDHKRLVAIAAMDGAVTGLADTHRLLVEAAVAYNAATSAESDERANVRRTGRFISELYEASGAVLAWYRLLEREVEDAGAFARQMTDDSTKMATDLQRGPMAGVFGDAAKYLRHAPNHGRAFDYDPDTDCVSIRLKSHSEVIPLEEFADRAFAFLETLLASVWGLENSLELAEIDVSLSGADALYLGFSPITLAAVTLPFLAPLTVERYAESDGVWSFDIKTDCRDIVLAVIALASNPRVTAREIAVRGSNEPDLVTKLSLWEELGSNTDQHTRMMSLLHLKANSIRGESSTLERSDLRFMIVVLGMATLDGDVSTIAHLRQLRRLAATQGWETEEGLAARVVSASRGVEVATVRQSLATMAGAATTPQLPTATAVRVLIDTSI